MTWGTKARRTSDLQSSSAGPLGAVRGLLLKRELREETELWTAAVEERRYIEGALGAPEGIVGRRGRDGKADAIAGGGGGALWGERR